MHKYRIFLRIYYFHVTSTAHEILSSSKYPTEAPLMHKGDFVSKLDVSGLNNIHACLMVLGASIQQLRATKEFGLLSLTRLDQLLRRQAGLGQRANEQAASPPALHCLPTSPAGKSSPGSPLKSFFFLIMKQRLKQDLDYFCSLCSYSKKILFILKMSTFGIFLLA